MTAVAPETSDAPELIARLLELELQLERERARKAGLERGIESLTATIEDLRVENARLRSDEPA